MYLCPKPTENTLVRQIKEEIAALSTEQLSEKFQELRRQEKMLKVANEALKDEIRARMGDEEVFQLDDSGFGAKIQHRNVWYVPLHKAEDIVEDRDTLSTISKGIDMKKAKELLDKDTYKELERARESLRTITALTFGKVT